MPYKDRAKQLAAQRAWNEKQTERRRIEREAQRRGESWRTGETHNLVHEGSIPSPATHATTPASTPPPTTPRLPRSPTENTRTPGRRQLREGYWRERDAGLSDTQAQARIKEQRAEQQRQAQHDHHEREIRHLAPQFIAQARARLSQCGFYREEDVLPAAMQLAEHSLHVAQTPRQADPLPKLITAPRPRPERGQVALPIAFGRVKAPAGSDRVKLSPKQQAEIDRMLRAIIARR